MNFLGDKRTSLDAIVQYIKSDEQGTITPKQKEILDKMKEADRLLSQYKSTPDVILMMKAKYPGMSHTTAWRMIRYAEYAYGPMRRFEKDYARRMIVDDMLKEIEIMKKDRPRYHKTIAAMYKNIMEAVGFKEEENVIDPDDLVMHQNVVVFVLDGKTFKMDLDKYERIPMEERVKMMEELESQNGYAAFEEVKE